MFSRMRAGGLVVFFCVSVVLVPGETFGGGFGGRGFVGRPVSIGSGFHQPRRFGFGGPLRHRLGYGLFPLTEFGGEYYSPGYGAPNFVEPYHQPAEAELETTGTIPGSFRPVIVYRLYRPGCQTQTVTVPSEHGGNRSINIVRCY